jgi:hypothetical protein
MTDEEFDQYFSNLTLQDKYDWLGKHVRTIMVHRGVHYHIDNVSDIDSVIEQELYEHLTGRQ